MLRSVVLLLCFSISPFIHSQVLANYELKSIEGDTYQVFDILEEGKPIVFYFFFVDCLNCHSVSPALANLYEENGGNTGCFEVIAMNVSDDSVAEIQNYAEDKGADFPFFNQADNPFILSFLSSFSEGSTIATPAVLMFAPDHSLIYKGNGIHVMSEGPMSDLVNDHTQLPCSSASGIDEIIHDFKIFPNPVDKGTPLNLNLQKAGTYTLKILDQTGKTIVNTQQVLELQSSFDLSGINAGVYFLSLESEDHNSVSKFVKL